jgi:hypothetical protein
LFFLQSTRSKTGENQVLRIERRERRNKFQMSSKSSGVPKSADGWRGKWFTIAKLGSQVDVFADTCKAIGEYVGKEFGHEMKILVTQGKETTFSVPELPEDATRQQELMWGKDYDLHLKMERQYKEQKAKVFEIVLGQCDETMRNRVESLGADFQKYEEECNVVALLKSIRECAFSSNDKQYPPRQAAMALKQLMTIHQQEDETLVAYYQRFVEVGERVERMFGDVIPGVIAGEGQEGSEGAESER